MKKRPAIPRLDGGPQTVLLVEDVERSAEFYRHILRFERKDGDLDRYAQFEIGNGGVLVLVKRDGSIAPMAHDASEHAPATLSFTVADDTYENWRRWFARRHVPIETEKKWVHGGSSLFVRDPDGRRLEFKTPPSMPPPPPVLPVERKYEY